MSDDPRVDPGVRRHFEAFSEEYDQSAEWCTDPRLLALLLDGIDAQRILDLGCGTGLVLEALHARGYRALGLDLAYPMLRQAKSRSGLGLVEGQAETLPFRSGVFDLIVCRQLLHYTQEAAALCEAARVLGSGGELRLAQVTAQGERDFLFWSVFKAVTQPLRRRTYTPALLRSLLKRCCFNVEEVLIFFVRRHYSFKGILQFLSLPREERAGFLDWMRSELQPLADLLAPAWSSEGLTVNQFWTVFRCLKRG